MILKVIKKWSLKVEEKNKKKQTVMIFLWIDQKVINWLFDIPSDCWFQLTGDDC